MLEKKVDLHTDTHRAYRDHKIHLKKKNAVH